MALTKLKIPPGVAKNGTPYQNSGRWIDSNCVRWFEGAMRPLGGWSAYTAVPTGVTTLTSEEAAVVSGVPRAMHAWKTIDNTGLVAIGTETAAYVLQSETLEDTSVIPRCTDISPTGLTTGDPDAYWVGSYYGYGYYGQGPYGRASEVAMPITQPGTWQFDNFGEELIGCLSSDGRLYKWAYGETQMSAIDAANPSTYTPATCVGVVVTPERFVVAIGADGNPRQIRWANQETYDGPNWDASDENNLTAGDLIIQGQGALMSGRRGRNETLLWTEDELYALRYQGAPLVYGVERLGTNCGPISKRAMTVVDSVAIWMGHDSFYLYDGYVKPLPSDIGDFVYRRLDPLQREKVSCWALSQFGEVWFSYPSQYSQDGHLLEGVGECNAIAVFNYREGHWTHHFISRTAGVDRGAVGDPFMASPTGYVYTHEKSTFNHQDEDGDALSVYAQSAPFEIEDGEQRILIRELWPDTFRENGPVDALNAQRRLDSVRMFISTSEDPTSDEFEYGPFSITQPTDCLISGRQVRIRVEENPAATGPTNNWRFGNLRIDGVKVGRR